MQYLSNRKAKVYSVTRSDERMWYSEWFACLMLLEEPCVKKFGWLTHLKFLGYCEVICHITVITNEENYSYLGTSLCFI